MGSASDYLRMVSNDARSIGSVRNGLTTYTSSAGINVLRLFQNTLLRSGPRVCTSVWDSRGVAPFTSIVGVAYGNGVIVIAGSGGAVNPLWYSTDNGLTWNPASGTLFPGGECSDVKFGGGKFVAVGMQAYNAGDWYSENNPNTYYSTDGVNWTQWFIVGYSPIYGRIPQVDFKNDQWTMVDESYYPVYSPPEGFTSFIVTNLAGVTIQPVFGMFPELLFNVTGYANDGNGTQLVFGRNLNYGNGDQYDTGYKITSTDTVLLQVPGIFPRVVAHGNGVWVVAGDSIVKYSTDGASSWLSCTGDLFDGGSIAKVRFINGAFYIIGLKASKGFITKSTDGQTWDAITPIPDVSEFFYDITCDQDGNLIAVSTTKVFFQKTKCNY